MSLHLFGTSNCILNGGWAQVLERFTSEQIINASIGASPSKAALYEAAKCRIERNDVAIIDYAITDEFYTCPHWNVSEESVGKDIASIVAFVARAGAYPIIMISPSARSMDRANIFEEWHVAAAYRTGAPVLNIAEMFRRAESFGADPRQMMRDDCHHAAATATVIARSVLDAVGQVRDADLRPSLHREEIWCPRVIPLSPLVPLERRIPMSSRLRATEMALLGEGDALRLEIGEDEVMLGLVLNMSGRGARVRIEGLQESETRDLIYDYINDDVRSYLALFAPIRTPIHGSVSGITLSVVPHGEEAPPSDLFRPSQLNLVYDEIAIEGVLVARASVTPAGRTTPKSIDLLVHGYDRYASDLVAGTTSAGRCNFVYQRRAMAQNDNENISDTVGIPGSARL